MDPIKPSDANNAGTVTPAPTVGQTVPPAAAKPAAVPPPAAPALKPGVSTPPVAKPEEPKLVPLSALHEERAKRQEESTKRQELEAELSKLKTQQQSYSQPQQVSQQPTQQPSYDQIRKEIDDLWDSDPKKAVQAEILVALDWRDRLDANVDLEADSLSRKYGDFGTYRTQAQAYVRSLPLQERAKPGILELSYLIVRGQNVDKIIEQQKNDLYAKFQSGELQANMANIPPGSYTPAPSSGGVTLNDEQLKVAAMMNLTPDQYASAIVNK